jgi:hypothetical protein
MPQEAKMRAPSDLECVSIISPAVPDGELPRTSSSTCKQAHRLALLPVVDGSKNIDHRWMRVADTTLNDQGQHALFASLA